MRSRLLALTGALALALGGLVVSASPAAAYPSHCAGFNVHPDIYNGGGISFKNPTELHAHPYTNCSFSGLGSPTDGINVHCATTNANNVLWLYVVNTTTDSRGWARYTDLNYSKVVHILDCYDATVTLTV